MSTRFILASNPTNLTAALEGSHSATVEAEYGELCVRGSVLTLAHHGPRSGNPAPCLASNAVGQVTCPACGGEVGGGCQECGGTTMVISDPPIQLVGLSHFDLDTLGGCAAVLGTKPDVQGFWELAAFIDLNGPHKLGLSGASVEDIRRLNAYWAWAESFRVYAPLDGGVRDVTSEVFEALDVLREILHGSVEYLEKGDAWVAEGEALNKTSYRDAFYGGGCNVDDPMPCIGNRIHIPAQPAVLLRESGEFVNHLYTHRNEVYRGVVGYNPETRAVTISLADPVKGISCCELAQTLWPDKDPATGKFLAGGHAGIAGSPRGKQLTMADARRAAQALLGALYPRPCNCGSGDPATLCGSGSEYCG